jgi:phosphate transport system permease protein
VGLFVFVPLFAAYVQIPLSNIVEGMPIVGTILYARSPSGLGILTAGIILAFMIIPFIASIVRDMLDQIPSVLRESAYGIGATTWEVVRHVLVPQAGVSIIGAIMLGLGRALGETMAVTFVVGNANRLSGSIMDPGSTIASRIANEFNEALGLQLNAPDRARLHPVLRHLRRPRHRAHPRLARQSLLSGSSTMSHGDHPPRP